MSHFWAFVLQYRLLNIMPKIVVIYVSQKGICVAISAHLCCKALSPEALSPEALSPEALSPEALSPEALHAGHAMRGAETKFVGAE